MHKLAPIALFVYNRPQHTERTLKFLQENDLAAKSDLFIFSDGPKTEAEKKNVSAVRKIIQQVKHYIMVLEQ